MVLSLAAQVYSHAVRLQRELKILQFIFISGTLLLRFFFVHILLIWYSQHYLTFHINKQSIFLYVRIVLEWQENSNFA